MDSEKRREAALSLERLERVMDPRRSRKKQERKKAGLIRRRIDKDLSKEFILRLRALAMTGTDTAKLN